MKSAVPAERKVAGAHAPDQDSHQQQYPGEAGQDFEFKDCGVGKQRHS
jgi:hypothetical protein